MISADFGSEFEFRIPFKVVDFTGRNDAVIQKMNDARLIGQLQPYVCCHRQFSASTPQMTGMTVGFFLYISHLICRSGRHVSIAHQGSWWSDRVFGLHDAFAVYLLLRTAGSIFGVHWQIC